MAGTSPKLKLPDRYAQLSKLRDESQSAFDACLSKFESQLLKLQRITGSSQPTPTTPLSLGSARTHATQPSPFALPESSPQVSLKSSALTSLKSSVTPTLKAGTPTSVKLRNTPPSMPDLKSPSKLQTPTWSHEAPQVQRVGLQASPMRAGNILSSPVRKEHPGGPGSLSPPSWLQMGRSQQLVQQADAMLPHRRSPKPTPPPESNGFVAERFSHHEDSVHSHPPARRLHADELAFPPEGATPESGRRSHKAAFKMAMEDQLAREELERSEARILELERQVEMERNRVHETSREQSTLSDELVVHQKVRDDLELENRELASKVEELQQQMKRMQIDAAINRQDEIKMISDSQLSKLSAADHMKMRAARLNARIVCMPLAKQVFHAWKNVVPRVAKENQVVEMESHMLTQSRQECSSLRKQLGVVSLALATWERDKDNLSEETHQMVIRAEKAESQLADANSRVRANQLVLDDLLKELEWNQDEVTRSAAKAKYETRIRNLSAQLRHVVDEYNKAMASMCSYMIAVSNKRVERICFSSWRSFIQTKQRTKLKMELQRESVIRTSLEGRIESYKVYLKQKDTNAQVVSVMKDLDADMRQILAEKQKFEVELDRLYWETEHMGGRLDKVEGMKLKLLYSLLYYRQIFWCLRVFRGWRTYVDSKIISRVLYQWQNAVAQSHGDCPLCTLKAIKPTSKEVSAVAEVDVA